jgi:hypothetical protein
MVYYAFKGSLGERVGYSGALDGLFLLGLSATCNSTFFYPMEVNELILGSGTLSISDSPIPT